MLVAGCQDPARTVSEGALRNATATGAATELHALGYRVEDRLACRIPASSTLSVVRVVCVGRTAAGQPVRVDAVACDADTRHPRQEFVIAVAGREVLRKPCLGAGCGGRSRIPAKS
jgi:hypothetical protein